MKWGDRSVGRSRFRAWLSRCVCRGNASVNGNGRKAIGVGRRWRKGGQRQVFRHPPSDTGILMYEVCIVSGGGPQKQRSLVARDLADKGDRRKNSQNNADVIGLSWLSLSPAIPSPRSSYPLWVSAEPCTFSRWSHPDCPQLCSTHRIYGWLSGLYYHILGTGLRDNVFFLPHLVIIAVLHCTMPSARP